MHAQHHGIPVRKTLIAVLLLSAFSFLAGCIAFPYKYTVQQEAFGHVYDAQTNQPIADALITVTKIDDGTGKPKITSQTRSDSEGYFTLPRVKKWGVFTIPNENQWIRLQWKITITANSYQDYTREIDTRYIVSPIDLNTINLKKNEP